MPASHTKKVLLKSGIDIFFNEGMTLREKKVFLFFLSVQCWNGAGQERQKEEEEEVDFDKKEGGQFPGFKPSRMFKKDCLGQMRIWGLFWRHLFSLNSTALDHSTTVLHKKSRL